VRFVHPTKDALNPSHKKKRKEKKKEKKKKEKKKIANGTFFRELSLLAILGTFPSFDIQALFLVGS